MASREWDYNRSELAVDAVVHIGGIGLALAGAVALIAGAAGLANARTAAAATIYALTLVAALTASALYSMWPVGQTKWQLRKYDHAAIFLLIAGTYTPFTLALGERGTWLLTFVWSVAVVGSLLKLFYPGRYSKLAVILYLGLAWSGMMMIDALLTSLPHHIFWMLIGGGLVYTAGVPFHLWQKLRFHKAVWHAFVLTAAIIHYNAVYLLIIS